MKPKCPTCRAPLDHIGRGTLVCNDCEFAHVLDNFGIDAINDVIYRERSEVSTAFLNSAWFLNRTGKGRQLVPISTGVMIDALDFIAFGLMAIEQVESGENDQNV